MLLFESKAPQFPRKKIVLTGFFYLDSRLDKMARVEILAYLAKLGYDVSFIAVRSRKNIRFKNQDINITAIPLRYVPLISPIIFCFVTLFYLPLYIIRNRPNFIIVEPSIGTLGFIWKPLLSHFLKFSVILDIRSPPVGIFGFSKRLRMIEFSISIAVAKKMFDGMTVITSLMKSEICKNYDVDPKWVGVWSSGVSLTVFKFENNSSGLDLRKKLGLSNKFIVVYHGVFDRRRGLIESVRAIALTKKKYPDIVLFLLGARSPVLEDLIQEHEIQDNVIIHNAVDYTDVPKYIAMSDVGIVPLPNISDWRYQCPLKLLEYLAMNKPVIITDIPANQEIVGNMKCGIYISSTDPSEIAEAMIYAYENRKELKEWAASELKINTKKYDWEKVAKDLENYLLWVESELDER